MTVTICKIAYAIAAFQLIALFFTGYLFFLTYKKIKHGTQKLPKKRTPPKAN